VIDGETLLERLSERPAGRELLELATDREDLELIGGATRDLLLGRTPRELDLVVAGDASTLAGEIGALLGLDAIANSSGSAGVTVHERFGTARVLWRGGRIDIAARRAERYPAPGALPQVSPGTPEQDLHRRDFTVNAIAVSLGGKDRGGLRTAPGALEDLAAGSLRVMHPRSFIDDPTRLLRLARYRVRLGFEPEPETAALAEAAIRERAMATVSGARIGAELRLALAEPDPVATLKALAGSDALAAVDQRLALNEPLARRALELLGGDRGSSEVLLLACLLGPISDGRDQDPGGAMRSVLDHLEFSASERDQAVRAALDAPALPARLQAARTPSQVREAAYHSSAEALALAGALAEREGLSEAAEAAHRWSSQVHQVRLLITGADLVEAGVAAGPEVGRRLELTLRRKLDGELAEGRDAELRAALEGS
jgi:tRNA nucleotidyltransferase (CCA-adding enzyme)